MNDKELLELAAKAAGYDKLLSWVDSWQCLTDCDGLSFDPLNDDGDRYRLAKKLKFVVDFEMCTVSCDIAGKPYIFQWGGAISEERAFVVAAAEIGKLL